jgi:xanthine dehydrogenase accessory factor
MNHSGISLGEFFAHYAARELPLVLATVTQTLGSTYRKAGAQMLIAPDGRAAGLLSGGCLEADLLERARTVLETGRSALVSYDTRSSDDLLWGIGLGCEGAMTILLVRLDRAADYQPFAFIDQCRRSHVPGSFALVTASEDVALPLGAAFHSGAASRAPAALAPALEAATTGMTGAMTVQMQAASVLIVPIELPPRLLVLGAGPDAMPLVEIAGLMNWHVTVLDHRPAYAVPERFPRAQRVALNAAAELGRELQSARYDAAVVMSHHLLSDQAYLAALADHEVPYVGLLGPAPRRARLLQELGDRSSKLSGRLRGPVGLDIGARTPETIALAIVGEIQAVLAGRPGGPFARSG